MPELRNSRGPNLHVLTGMGKIPLQQYIIDSGVSVELSTKIKGRLHNYRHRNNHRRAQLTQKEIAFLNHQISQIAAQPPETPKTETPKTIGGTLTQTPKPALTYDYITITDYLEQLIGKTIVHETFPIQGIIIEIDNETMTIDFNGKIANILLSESNGLLVHN